MDSKEIKRLASDTSSFDKISDAITQKYEGIKFNDRNTLLDLIEYTRNASPGYGITNILDNFCEEKNSKCLNTLS